MNKFSAVILLFLCSLLFAGFAEARLTLGVVGGDDSVRALADRLSRSLNEEVEVKTLADTATLLNWLERFAMVDLAVLPTTEVAKSPGRYLVLGKIGANGEMSLIAAQGGGGDLPLRLSPVLVEYGASLWGPPAVTATLPIKSPVVVPDMALSAVTGNDERVPKGLVPLPAQRPGKAWTPEGDMLSRDILATSKPSTDSLVIGMALDPRGPVRTQEQAERLAGYLQRALLIPVTPRTFSQVDNLTEWLRRYRMVDVAILSPETAVAALEKYYRPVVGMYRHPTVTAGPSSLMVARLDLADELFSPLQTVLVNMTVQEEGRALLAELDLRSIQSHGTLLSSAEAFEQPAVVAVPLPLVPDTQAPEPLIVEPQIVEPQVVEPQVAEPQVAEPQIAEPQIAEPQIAEPQIAEPQMPALSVEAPEPSFVDAIAPIKEPVSQVLREETSPTIPPLPGVLALPAERLEVVVAEREPPGLPPLPEEPVTAAPPVTEAPPGVPLPPPQKETTPPVITILPAAPKASALASAPVLPALPSSPERPALGELIAEQKPASPAPVAEIPAHAAPQEPPVVTVILPIEPPADLPLAADDAGGGAEGASVAVTPQPGVPIGAVAADENLQESPAAVHRPPAVPVDSSEDVIALLGDDSVASIVAQPELPEELRPSGIPILRPGRLPKKASVEEDERLLADMPLPLQKSTPPRLPSLLPEPEQDLGIVYVFPFVTVMVPEEVDDRLFDQFIDTLNDQGASLNLQFVILKEGLQRVDPAWLAVRKYVTGEIYAYVEDSGCCSTDLRTKARVTYRRPRQAEPAFNFEYTTKRFFDHDHSTLVKERVALADNLARILADKLLESMKN